jgi:hypothetical protein
LGPVCSHMAMKDTQLPSDGDAKGHVPFQLDYGLQ